VMCDVLCLCELSLESDCISVCNAFAILLCCDCAVFVMRLHCGSAAFGLHCDAIELHLCCAWNAFAL
jgi:hypothetical protein